MHGTATDQRKGKLERPSFDNFKSFIVSIKYMRIIVSEGILEKYSDNTIGIIIARDLTVAERSGELEALKKKVIDSVLAKYQIESLANHPYLAAWRSQYESFGVSVKKRQPSSETLIRKVLSGQGLPVINTLVDTSNVSCLMHFLPTGVYDLDKIKGNVYIRYANDNDLFTPIGGRETEKPQLGEVVYADEEKVLTRRWNYRDSEYVKATVATKNAYLSIEGAKDVPEKSVEDAIQQLAELVTRFCGGKTEIKLENLRRINDWSF